jgi:hypothetical protein
MAQRKIDTTISDTPSVGALREAASLARTARHSADEDFVADEYQRRNRVGPDFDPNYFDKLEELIEENYGPVVEYKIVNG